MSEGFNFLSVFIQSEHIEKLKNPWEKSEEIWEVRERKNKGMKQESGV